MIPPTIYKVSSILRDVSKSSFSPEMVSIGPIHRKDPKLKEFKWMKECYLDHLLRRCDDSTPEKTLAKCLVEVNTLIPKIRESYGGMIENYIDDKVATMMVMDGCFILEFCFKHEEEELYLPNKMLTGRIAMDLILLENRVPFLVLQALFYCTKWKASSNNLRYTLDVCLARYIKIFRSRSPLPETIIRFNSDSTPDHVLGYLHKRYQLVAKPSNPINTKASKPVAAKSWNPIHALKSKLVAAKSFFSIRALISKLVAAKSLISIRTLISKLVVATSLIPKHGRKSKLVAVHSIVELDSCGVNFKPHRERNWSMSTEYQLSFVPYSHSWSWHKATLLMPILIIDDTTELILRNFIAYEQSFPKDRYYFTSYAHVMDTLINTQEDIAKLVESKVLVNMLGSNQEAADMINKICKNITITKFCYTEMFKQMDEYYNDKLNKDMAWLKRVYFDNTWKFYGLIAAIILFSLTVVQTIYAIKGK